MSNEKYINYYVEILGSTLSDAVLRNVSLQANEKISSDIIEELQSNVETLRAEIGKLTIEKLQSESDKEKANIEEIGTLKTKLDLHDETITNLQNKITELTKKESEFDNTKHQLAHLDTFRSELVKTQKELEEAKNKLVNVDTIKNQLTQTQSELNGLNNIIKEKDTTIDELTKKVEYLQLTPAKRKKLEEAMQPVVEVNQLPLSSDDTTKDGGIF
jgi:chromosome segregation ATPase